MGVNPGDSGDPRYLYSIGLWHSFQHPEIIVLGLHNDAAARIGQLVGEKVASGHKYAQGEIDHELIHGYETMFLNMPRSLSARWMLSDNWLYGEENFPIFQIVFQDEDRNWPWDDEAPIQFLRNQPLLGRRCK